MLPVLLALSCTKAPESGFVSSPAPRDSDLESGQPRGQLSLQQKWTAWAADEELGAAVAAGGGRRFGGAPGSGTVYELGEDMVALLEADGRAGHTLAWSERLVVGAPLHGEAGALLDEAGAPLAEGEEHAALGAWLQVSGGELLATAGQAVWRDGTLVAAGGRVVGAAVLAGDLIVFEAAESGERGRTTCTDDLDGDGDEELAVGDPGAGTVALYEAGDLDTEVVELSGAGRFGAALACADGVLAIGAPAAEQHAGAVWLYGDGELVEVATGQAGDELGFSLAWDGAELLVGAPGGADLPGSVHLYGP